MVQDSAAWVEIVNRYAREHALSAQEKRLLALAVAGRTDKCIADALACRRSTIATYWRRIFVKTGLRPQRAVLVGMVRFAGAVITSANPTQHSEQAGMDSS